MDNIEVFDVASLEILRLCLDDFPIPVFLKAEDIASAVLEFYPENYFDEQPAGKLRDLCQHTIYWLNKERIILVEVINDRDRPKGTLTRKGLVLLNRVPSTISEPTFRDVISKGLSNIPAALVSSIVAQLFNK
ncbi:hypothetical protein [uncultured Psychromonas sp.]|uniref:hypothetical protein n=1 Tax=uncultured Psychromonas sp. TaxID=173974 RepID=UPI00260E559B|nr:hypothetical protein [uncultured Psychromonas sp.]